MCCYRNGVKQCQHAAWRHDQAPIKILNAGARRCRRGSSNRRRQNDGGHEQQVADDFKGINRLIARGHRPGNRAAPGEVTGRIRHCDHGALQMADEPPACGRIVVFECRGPKARRKRRDPARHGVDESIRRRRIVVLMRKIDLPRTNRHNRHFLPRIPRLQSANRRQRGVGHPDDCARLEVEVIDVPRRGDIERAGDLVVVGLRHYVQP